MAKGIYEPTSKSLPTQSLWCLRFGFLSSLASFSFTTPTTCVSTTTTCVLLLYHQPTKKLPSVLCHGSSCLLFRLIFSGCLLSQSLALPPSTVPCAFESTHRANKPQETKVTYVQNTGRDTHTQQTIKLNHPPPPPSKTPDFDFSLLLAGFEIARCRIPLNRRLPFTRPSRGLVLWFGNWVSLFSKGLVDFHEFVRPSFSIHIVCARIRSSLLFFYSCRSCLSSPFLCSVRVSFFFPSSCGFVRPRLSSSFPFPSLPPALLRLRVFWCVPPLPLFSAGVGVYNVLDELGWLPRPCDVSSIGIFLETGVLSAGRVTHA